MPTQAVESLKSLLLGRHSWVLFQGLKVVRGPQGSTKVGLKADEFPRLTLPKPLIKN